MNIDKLIILYTKKITDEGIKGITIGEYVSHFSSYSRGYIHDRILVLQREGYLITIKFKSRQLKLSNKSERWLKELEEEEQ